MTVEEGGYQVEIPTNRAVHDGTRPPRFAKSTETCRGDQSTPDAEAFRETPLFKWICTVSRDDSREGGYQVDIPTAARPMTVHDTSPREIYRARARAADRLRMRVFCGTSRCGDDGQ